MGIMAASSQEIIAFLLGLPQFRFAALRAEGDRLILVYENRDLAEITVAPSPREREAAAAEALNALIHRGLYHSPLASRPPGEAVNAAHQLVELWDALSFAIARAG